MASSVRTTMTTNATGLTPATRHTAAEIKQFPPDESAEDSGGAVSASLNHRWARYGGCLVVPVCAADPISTTTAASDKRRVGVDSRSQITRFPLSVWSADANWLR